MRQQVHLIYIPKMKETLNSDLVVLEMYDERMKETNHFRRPTLLIPRDSHPGKIKKQ